MTMDEEKVTTLINEVQKRPLIWDKQDSDYKNTKRKGLEWDKIAGLLRESKTRLQSKWKALEKKFKEELKQIKNNRSGDGLEDAYFTNWPYYELLTFLETSAEVKPSTGNLDSLFIKQETIDQSQLQQQESKQTTPSLTMMSDQSQNNLAQIIQQSLQPITVNRQISNEIIDKLNLSFFETLLPPLRELSQAETLLCRNEITNTIYKYAYKENCTEKKEDKFRHVIEAKGKRGTFENININRNNYDSQHEENNDYDTNYGYRQRSYSRKESVSANVCRRAPACTSSTPPIRHRTPPIRHRTPPMEQSQQFHGIKRELDYGNCRPKNRCYLQTEYRRTVPSTPASPVAQNVKQEPAATNNSDYIPAATNNSDYISEEGVVYIDLD